MLDYLVGEFALFVGERRTIPLSICIRFARKSVAGVDEAMVVRAAEAGATQVVIREAIN
jgi:hypothetical protein